MSRPTRVLFTGPLTSFAEGFARDLIRQGYRAHPTAHQLRLVANLSQWLEAKRRDAADMTPELLNEYLTARRAAGYAQLLTPQGLAPLMEYLRKLGAVTASTKPPSPAEEVLDRYRRYLLAARGLAEKSTDVYVGILRKFVVTRMVRARVDWTDLSGADLSAFVRAACRHRCLSSARLVVTALRSLLGYLHVEGLIPESLVDAVPMAAGWKLAGLPKSLEPGELKRLLATCSRETPIGRRDLAMLMLLCRLGLRAGEVRALTLDDIDWRAGELVVCGKGQRIERLPLPADVGQAVANYLRRGRPITAQARTVFVRVRAPHLPLSAAGVTHVVYVAASRAGLAAVNAHRLRHTVATQMVRAGVPLPEIGQVLRHRRLLTTAIYAKVDREGLRSLARRWPGGVS